MATRARIATVCQAGRAYPTVEQNRDYILTLLDRALIQSPDLVCLPETFSTVSVPGQAEDLAEPLPGPTTDLFARRARERRAYVICPLITRRDGRCWNSAVLLDRDGQIAGVYDKAHPVTTSYDYSSFEDGMMPGGEPPVFDLDFGRIGVQICFDAGFPENWQRLADQGARAVVWVSAYNGGFPLQAYAYLHHYYVVSAVRPSRSRIIDPCGAVLAQTDDWANVIWRDVNLDYAVCHYDWNYSIPERIQARYPGRVDIRSYPDEAHFIVEPLDAALTVAALQREFGFETAAQYHQRHRDAHARMRAGQPALPQAAAHGDRPEYGKW
jgi:predicted amidohydrolase